MRRNHNLALCSWLIDVDRDDEGMRVIADLHGGDPEDLAAKTEFREIKERVIAEVLFFSGSVRQSHILNSLSVRVGRPERTRQCGGDTNEEFFLL